MGQESHRNEMPGVFAASHWPAKLALKRARLCSPIPGQKEWALSLGTGGGVL